MRRVERNAAARLHTAESVDSFDCSNDHAAFHCVCSSSMSMLVNRAYW